MRILACADLHGRPERVDLVRRLADEHAPDAVVLAGDLGGWDDELAALRRLELPVPVLAVSGNMDSPETLLVLAERGWLLTDRPSVVGGVSFGGPAVQGPCDVLVVHLPPAGTLDVVPSGHIGSRRTLEALRRLWPRVLICGHVHESPGVERAEGTLVVNCSMGAGRAAGAWIELAAGEATARLL
jgi:uncharacterized protein